MLLCAALRNRRQCTDKNGAHSGGQKGASVWKKYRAWDGAQPFETVLRTKNGEWVQTQGFDPFTQSTAYYRLTGDAPETNTVKVSVQNASRDAVYAPASMEKVTDGDVYERRDALLKGRGLFGTRDYTVTEVSGTRPSELMVAESWVSSPQTEEQTAYAEAESVYRSFVYDAYTAADEKLLPVLNRLFWQDYDDENDGVYSALSRIREVLKAQVRYSETAEAAPDNADPIAYFLTNSRKGNAVLYASATVQALRAHGIPRTLCGRRMSIEERVRQSQKLIFKLISLWELTRRSAGRHRRPIRRLRTRCRRLSPESTSV